MKKKGIVILVNERDYLLWNTIRKEAGISWVDILRKGIDRVLVEKNRKNLQGCWSKKIEKTCRRRRNMKNNKKEKSKKEKVLAILARHIGSGRSISMVELYEQVYGKKIQDKINDTRKLRAIITELRQEGVPVCSDMSKEGGGYYLAAAGGELEAYCRKLRIKALKILRLEAVLRNMTLPELIGQLSLNFAHKQEGGEEK